MSQSPLNGDTEMTLGSELQGILLVKPPSQHRCKKREISSLNWGESRHCLLWFQA